MKIKFDTDNDLPLNKLLKLYMLIIVGRSIFEKDRKYYPPTNLFRWVFLLVIKILQYNRTDVSEGIDINKTSASKKCDICHYWMLLIYYNHMFVMVVMLYQ